MNTDNYNYYTMILMLILIACILLSLEPIATPQISVRLWLQCRRFDANTSVKNLTMSSWSSTCEFSLSRTGLLLVSGLQCWDMLGGEKVEDKESSFKVDLCEAGERGDWVVVTVQIP